MKQFTPRLFIHTTWVVFMIMFKSMFALKHRLLNFLLLKDAETMQIGQSF